MTNVQDDSQRIDKWLWYARFFKTRSLASKIVAGGKVRISNGDKTERISKASQQVKVGDTLTFTAGRRVRVVKVLAPGDRRGPAEEARLLYEEVISPSPQAGEADSSRAARGGRRPTKKDRRVLNQVKNNVDW